MQALAGSTDFIGGGAVGDTVQTYLGEDTITGGGGDDLIDAGAGFDAAMFSGDRADYTITEDNVNGRLIVTDQRGIDGADTLISVNRLEFADQ